MAMEISREEGEDLEREEREVAMMGALLTWHTRCNERCKGRVHSEIVWIGAPGLDPRDLPRRELSVAIAATMESNFGAQYVAHAPAPDAVRDPAALRSATAVGVHSTSFGALVSAETEVAIPDEIAEGQVAYRVTFRSPIRIRMLRRQYLATSPEAAAAMGFVDEGDSDDD